MQDKVWNKLLEFESRDLIERYIQKKYARDCSARQVLEISSNFIQGREYFKNAQHSAMTVKPLLQYYGVTALTRGLILAIAPHLSESSLKPAHGLETLNWRDSLAKKDFENLQVNIRQGTFFDLLNSTENKSYFKSNSSGVNWHVYLGKPESGSSIKLGELIQTFPDLREEFETWSQKKLNFLFLSSFKHNDDTTEYEFSKTPNANSAIEQIFPKKLTGEYTVTEKTNSIMVKITGTYTPHFSQSFYDSFNSGIGDVAVTRLINEDINLSSIAGFYSLSFYLGMLSRYFPSVWISLGRTEKGDAIYPLFSKIIGLIETNFPKLILEYLDGPYPFEKK